jgi:hypothetical protein
VLLGLLALALGLRGTAGEPRSSTPSTPTSSPAPASAPPSPAASSVVVPPSAGDGASSGEGGG